MLVHRVLNSATVKNNDLHVLMRKIFAPVANIFIGKTVHFVKVEENEGGDLSKDRGSIRFYF